MSVKGWVYVITNKAMPGLVKIGYSLKDPSLRAAEFNGTGTPHPYKVEYEALVFNPREIEQRTHIALQSEGLHENKEWFKCSVLTAIANLENSARSYSALIYKGSKPIHQTSTLDTTQLQAWEHINSFEFNKLKSTINFPEIKSITEETRDALKKVGQPKQPQISTTQMISALAAHGWKSEHDGFKWTLRKYDKSIIAYTTDDLHRFYMKITAD